MRRRCYRPPFDVSLELRAGGFIHTPHKSNELLPLSVNELLFLSVAQASFAAAAAARVARAPSAAAFVASAPFVIVPWRSLIWEGIGVEGKREEFLEQLLSSRNRSRSRSRKKRYSSEECSSSSSDVTDSINENEISRKEMGLDWMLRPESKGPTVSVIVEKLPEEDPVEEVASEQCNFRSDSYSNWKPRKASDT
ncbi:uncharacterized protein DS421_13g408370 [Arachis hypogaea]|nr:uncharacterized protein DS421_13g408370 [Arachis hypogaea]